MKQFLVISLLVLGLTAGRVMGDCSDCEDEDGKECVHNECRCKVDYFTSKETGKCTETCDSLTTDADAEYVKYNQSMFEQGNSFAYGNMSSAAANETACMSNCSTTAECVGFAVKRNELSDRGKCFYFDRAAEENNLQQWKDDKGRWLYYAKKCQ